MKEMRIFWLFLLLAGLLIEVGFLTFWRNSLGLFISPVIWMLGGIITCVSGFFLLSYYDNKSRHNSSAVINSLLVSVTFIDGTIWCSFFLQEAINQYPIDASVSDIIPSLEYYVQRFLSGEKVYKPIPFEGYTVDPTYLPFLWLPYCIAELLEFDYRWVAYGAFLLGLLMLLLKMCRKSLHPIEAIIKTAVPFTLLWILIYYNPGNFGMAVELLPAGYYFILVLTIFHRYKWLVALGILLCLLSRYVFTFWLPLYLILYLIEFGFRNVVKVIAWLTAGVLIFYIIPFFMQDWTILTKGLQSYEVAALGQWHTQHW